MGWFPVYTQVALTGYRVVKSRVRNHPLLLFWFVLLILAFFGIILKLFEFSIAQSELDIFEGVDRNGAVFMLFFLFLAKSTMDGINKGAASKEMTFLLSAKIRRRDILAGILVALTLFNLAIVALIFGIAVPMIVGLHMALPTDPYLLVYAIQMCLLGTFFGFVYAFLLYIQPLWKKLAYMSATTPFLSVLYYLMTYSNLSDQDLALYILVVYALSLPLLLLVNRVMLDTWNSATNPGKNISGKVKLDGTVQNPLMARIIGKNVLLLFTREVLRMMRTRHILGAIITLLAVSGGLYYLMNKFSDLDTSGIAFGSMILPLIMGLGIYMAVVLEQGVDSLSAVGREGKNIWILKSGPYSGKEVIRAKTLASLVFSPVVVINVSFVTAIQAGYSFGAGAFAIMGSLSMVFIAVGLGQWFGARFPNFDETSKGSPDMMMLYIYAMVVLLLAFLFCTIPLGVVLLYDLTLGLLVMAFFTCLAALLLILCVHLAGRRFDNSEFSF